MVGLGLFIYKQFFFSVGVRFEIGIGVQAEVGTSNNEELAINKPISTLNSSKTLRLAPGNYVVNYSSNNHIPKTEKYVIKVGQVIKAPTLSLTPGILSKQFASEAKDIETAVRTNPLGRDYRFSDGQLYVDGNWCAAKLMPGDSVNNDVLRVVLQKQGDTWKIVAGPKIIFYLKDYPGIPEAVIRDINNR